ncbi:hypothetical protein [Stenotrophomonas maltophilia]|uniref:hypothetical protein n=1 Tax=Stenotrophomonas maltophilia TaxID=40324 RepID=UPI0013FDB55F|nr:hypothetical protein [Stenotrophomonas maltophilia]
MDFTKVATITIEFEALQDLLAERANNPIANAEIPEMLRTAIQSGTKVLLTDALSDNSLELKLGADGNFMYEPAV